MRNSNNMAIVRLAVPNLLGFVAQLAMSVIDGVTAAKLGTGALAAISLVLPFQMLLIQASNGAFGAATAGMVARAFGAADRERANAEAIHALVTAAAISVPLSLLGILFGKALFQRLGGSGAALDFATSYSGILFGGCLITWVNASLGGISRGAGRMWLPAGSMIVAAAIHLLLCTPLTVGWAGFPGLGIRGIPISWLLSTGISTVLLAYGLFRTGVIRRSPHLAWRLESMSGLLKVALPAIVAAALSNGCVMATMKIASRYGQETLIGVGLGARLEYVLVPFAFSIGVALITLSGQARGAGRDREARKLALSGVAGSGILVGSIGIIAAIFPELWLQFFAIPAVAHTVAYHYLRVLGPFYAFFGIGLTAFFASQAFGRMVPATAGTAMRLLAICTGGVICFRYFPGDVESFIWFLAGAFTLFGLANLLAIRYLSAERPVRAPESDPHLGATPQPEGNAS